MDVLAVSAITGAVDFATIITGIGAVAAAVAVLFVSIKGGKTLINFIR